MNKLVRFFLRQKDNKLLNLMTLVLRPLLQALLATLFSIDSAWENFSNKKKNIFFVKKLLHKVSQSFYTKFHEAVTQSFTKILHKVSRRFCTKFSHQVSPSR